MTVRISSVRCCNLGHAVDSNTMIANPLPARFCWHRMLRFVSHYDPIPLFFDFADKFSMFQQLPSLLSRPVHGTLREMVSKGAGGP